MPNLPDAEIGVIGGSGLYSFLDCVTEVTVETPYGPPSDALLVGEYSGRTVAFLPRHGRNHSVPPHRINYRANLWALRSVGVRQILAPCAVGGLRPEFEPGTLVLPDQLVDRTYGREHTFYDGGRRPDGAVPQVVHIPMADPYCPAGRESVLAAARAESWEPRTDATLVVIQGPRFSTRAESRWNSAAGGSIVGMTGQPEASLARELGICYTSIALVTDLDAGVEVGEGVTHDEVLRVFAENIERLRPVLFGAVKGLSSRRSCPCSHALDGVDTGIGVS
jgi:5'-methylthioadenosine phosphorylase